MDILEFTLCESHCRRCTIRLDAARAGSVHDCLRGRWHRLATGENLIVADITVCHSGVCIDQCAAFPPSLSMPQVAVTGNVVASLRQQTQVSHEASVLGASRCNHLLTWFM